jgi:hypothetical protein
MHRPLRPHLVDYGELAADGAVHEDDAHRAVGLRSLPGGWQAGYMDHTGVSSSPTALSLPVSDSLLGLYCGCRELVFSDCKENVCE